MSTEAEAMMVPLWGTGEIIDLTPAPAAIKAATDEELGAWFAVHHKPVMETFGLVKEELTARMAKRGQTMLPIPSGQTIELTSTPKRECDGPALIALGEKINAAHGTKLELVRIKTEHKPNMNAIKKAFKLGEVVEKEIKALLTEEPGRPRLGVKGLTEKQQDRVFNV